MSSALIVMIKLGRVIYTVKISRYRVKTYFLQAKFAVGEFVQKMRVYTKKLLIDKTEYLVYT